MRHAPALNSLPGVRHGFFTREGGQSHGLYAGLNCGLGSGDHPETVQANRAYCAISLDVEPEALVTVHQQHTPTAVSVSEPWAEAPIADAMVTDKPGIALGILTADCAPVLLADHDAGIVAAAHAGWKGALGGIIEATVTAMEKKGARRTSVLAAIGPCISADSYEVGPEFQARFESVQSGNGQFFRSSPNEGHAYFDLRGYVVNCLTDAGVRAVSWLENDTYAEEDLFFSYRRSCHRGEPDYGRQLSAIALSAE